MVIYEKPNYIQVVYHPDKNFIVFDWTDFRVPLIELRKLHKEALATAQENECYYYIAETSKVRTVLSRDVIKWWGEVWTPRLAAAGIQAIVTVVPTSTLAILSTQAWQAQVVGGITMKNVKNFAEAEAMIKMLQSTNTREREL